MASVTASSLHLLSIDLGSAPNSLRAVLELGRDDVEHWLKRAQDAGVPLAIVCGPDRVDLYSSDAGRRAAFKPLLESLWALGRNLDGFEHVRTQEAYGHAAVRHLLRQAAGLESTEHGLSYAGCIADACARATRYGTLSDGLSELFQVASSTADRSHAETELSAPYSTRASRQLEALSAERIMEEELTAFRAATTDEASTRATLPAPRPSVPAQRPTVPAPRPAPVANVEESASLPPYTTSEPTSCVRLRVAPFSLVPVATRRLG